MADYYTQFSFVVPVDDPADVLAELSALNVAWLEAGTGDHPIYGSEDDWCMTPSVEAEDECIWISDDGGTSDVECTVKLVQWLLTKPGAPETLGFEWANTCSRPRVDAYGGGCVAISRDKALYRSSGEMISILLAQLDKENR